MNTIHKVLNSGWGKWLIVIFIFLGLFIYAFNQFYLNKWLSKKLQKTVKVQSQGLYALQLGTLRFSVFTGRLTIDELSIVPDFTLWEKQQATNNALAPAMLVKLDARRLHLAGLSIIDLLRKRPINLNEIKATQPVLHITQMKADSGVSEPLHTRLKGLLANLRIKNLQADSSTVIFNTSYKNKQNSLELHGLQVIVADLQFDKSAYKNKKRVLYARKIVLSATNANLLLPDGTYRLKTGKLLINTLTQEIKIGQFALVPLYRPKELARRKDKAVTWFEVKVPDIQMKKVNFAGFYHLSNMVVGSIQLNNPVLNAYMDRKNFEQKGRKPLPHELIQKLSTGFNIRKILIKNMKIKYEELAPESDSTGVITFENTYATITNITNDKNYISGKNPAVIDLRTAIMGKALLKTTIQLNLLDPNGSHSITGSVGSTEAGILNNILGTTTFIIIKSGYLQRCSFNIKLNRREAAGTMRAAYKDFKIDLLSKNKDKRQSFGKKVLSAIVNKVAVDSDNLPNEEFRVGKIAVNRKTNRSVFSYWKDCLASGFLSSVGVGELAAKK